jgi:hypothetical protein
MVTFEGHTWDDDIPTVGDDISIQVDVIKKVLPVPPSPMREKGWRSRIETSDATVYLSTMEAADLVAAINRGARAEAEELKRIDRTLLEILGHLKQNP